jgi:predicted esterase
VQWRGPGAVITKDRRSPARRRSATLQRVSTLIALHGFSQTGERFRTSIERLLERLPARVTVLFPDGPHACSEQSVQKLYAWAGAGRRPDPPHRCWWDASDDGRQYHGWEASIAALAAHVTAALEHGARPLGVLGFSQGAIAAAALAGLAAHGEFPALDYAILVAGRSPRSEALRGLFDPPLALPSLHVWGEKDPFAMSASARLVELFAPGTREVKIWAGPHIVPTRGAASDALVEFIERHG